MLPAYANAGILYAVDLFLFLYGWRNCSIVGATFRAALWAGLVVLLMFRRSGRRVARAQELQIQGSDADARWAKARSRDEGVFMAEVCS